MASKTQQLKTKALNKDGLAAFEAQTCTKSLGWILKFKSQLNQASKKDN